jgi:hypothetical protein
VKATLGILYSLVPALGLAQPSPGTVASWNVKPVASGGGYTGTIFYVDVGGSDANNGTSAGSPWKTLHYAATNAAVSNNCIIKATSGQIFPETNFVITNLNALPNGSNVVFTTTGSAPAIISNWLDGSATAPFWQGAGFACAVIDSTYLTFSNLVFEGNQSFFTAPSGYPCGVLIAGNIQDIHHLGFDNCGFQWINTGVEFAPGFGSLTNFITNVSVINSWANSNVTIGYHVENWNAPAGYWDYNIFFTNDVASNCPGIPGFSGNGFQISANSNTWLVNCVAHDGGYANIGGGVGGAAVDIFQCVSTHVIGGEYYNWSNNFATDGEGICLDYQVVNSSVERAYVHNCQSAGIYCYGNYGGNTIRFNTTIGNGTDDGVEMSIDVGSPTNLLIYGNNFIATVNWAIPFNDYIGATSSVLANNILWCSDAAYVLTTAGTGWTCWNNDYERGDGAAFSVDWGGTVYSSVAAWQSATGQDANALTANPYWLNGYIDPTFYPATPQTSTNWILSAGNSTLINAAANLGAKFGINNGGRDFLGNPLGTTYNIGAVNASQ